MALRGHFFLDIDMWKQKFIAFAIHLLATLVTSGICAVIVYGSWYPGAFAQMVGGADILKLIIVAEFFLGPVMSFVIYNAAKTRRHLMIDYCVVGILQFTALVYGVVTVESGRPIYMVFVKDRLEVIAKTELTESELAKISDPEITPSWSTFKNICVEYPADAKERSDLLMSAMGGRDIQLKPQYYRSCKAGEVQNKTYSKDRLFSNTPIKIEDLPEHLRAKEFTWLPVVNRFSVWLVVYVKGEQEVYLNLDPLAEPPSSDQIKR